MVVFVLLYGMLGLKLSASSQPACSMNYLFVGSCPKLCTSNNYSYIFALSKFCVHAVCVLLDYIFTI